MFCAAVPASVDWDCSIGFVPSAVPSFPAGRNAALDAASCARVYAAAYWFW